MGGQTGLSSSRSPRFDETSFPGGFNVGWTQLLCQEAGDLTTNTSRMGAQHYAERRALLLKGTVMCSRGLWAITSKLSQLNSSVNSVGVLGKSDESSVKKLGWNQSMKASVRITLMPLWQPGAELMKTRVRDNMCVLFSVFVCCIQGTQFVGRGPSRFCNSCDFLYTYFMLVFWKLFPLIHQQFLRYSSQANHSNWAI